MVQLRPEHVGSVSSLFDDELPNRPMLESVLADRSPGWVFADREARPTAAVVVAHYGFTYVGGRPDRDLLAFALGRSAPAADPLVICFRDEAVGPGGFMQGGRTIDRIEFSALEPTWAGPPPLPEGVGLRPMTRRLLEQCLWKGEVVADCGSLERFLEIGFGVCGVAGGRVVSEAYASIPGDRAFEIGPIVHPEFRRQGLAYATCAALIDECRRRGYATLWSCDRSNQASARLARKLGYRREQAYTFWVPGRDARAV